MPDPRIEEECRRLRALLSKTDPRSPAHREILDVLRVLDEELRAAGSELKQV
jgi:hypothetical protein